MTKSTINIGILTGCSSDRHLSEPIYSELRLLDMHPYFITLTQNNIIDSLHAANYHFNSFEFSFVLAVGDRQEQMGGVLAAFDNNIPVGHLYAGDLNTGVSDDIHRAAITIYSDIQFCSCRESTENTIKLMYSAGLIPNTNTVGATHFNGKNIEKIKSNEYELNTQQPYILILLNSENKGNDYNLIDETMEKLKYFFPNEHPCNFKFNIAKGNGDSEDIETKLFCELMKRTDGEIEIIKYNRQNHDFFLSLIANSYMFITNSSSSIYEAPVLLDNSKIIHVGNRNKNRTCIPLSSHDWLASRRVSKLIKTFLEARA